MFVVISPTFTVDIKFLIIPVLDDVLDSASEDMPESVNLPEDPTVVTSGSSFFSKRCSEDI